MLFPYMFDACSTELLKETRSIANELDLPVHMHIGQYPEEYSESIRRYGKTPVHHLYDIGFLAPKTILTHQLFTSLNPLSQAPGLSLMNFRDINMLAEMGVTLGHTPIIWARIRPGGPAADRRGPWPSRPRRPCRTSGPIRDGASTASSPQGVVLNAGPTPRPPQPPPPWERRRL